MSMKKDLIDTIMEKEFHELSADERAEIQSFCATEEEFNQARDVFTRVEAMAFETPTPKVETKERLDDLFHQSYPKVAPIWYMSVAAVVVPKNKVFYRQPLLQVAAIGLLFLLIYPVWTSEVVSNDAPQQQVAQAEIPEKDTPIEVKEIRNDAPAPVAETPVVDEKVERTQLATVDSEPVMQDLTAATPGSTEHPDGVYVSYSQPASQEPEMLDLLTTTF